MTTTSTFQGLEGKPSSRVLAAPGGGSSNIFGHYEETAPSRGATKKDNIGEAAAVSEQKSVGAADVLSQGQAAAQPQKARPPRSGDDSFNTLFGDNSCSPQFQSPSKTSHTNNEQRPSYGTPIRKNMTYDEDTFSHVFGEVTEPKAQGRRRESDNSFSRVFCQQPSVAMSKFEVSAGQGGTSGFSCSDEPSAHDLSSNASLSSSLSRVTISPSKRDEDAKPNSSFSRVFGQNSADGDAGQKRQKTPGRGAFNPITGEPYETAPKAQPNVEDGQNADGQEEQRNGENTAVQGNQAASAAQRQQPSADRIQPSTRVIQPPGGRSTQLW